MGYTAENNEIESEVVDAPTRYLKIVNLKKNTNYTITVSASTVKGYGPASELLSVVTNQDGTYISFKLTSFTPFLVSSNTPFSKLT